MRRAKIMMLIASALVCTFLVSTGNCAYAAENADTKAAVTSEQSVSTLTATDGTRLQDDFYKVINNDWLNSAKIAAGHNSNSNFDEVSDKVTEQNKTIINDLLANENSYSENSNEKKIINLYKNILNMEERDKTGKEAVKDVIDAVNNIKSVKDISALDYDSKISNSLLSMDCDRDYKDTTRHALVIGTTSLGLGNPDDYTKPTEYSNKVKSLVENYYTKVLTLSGFSEAEAKTKVDNVFKFENMIAPYITGVEERSKDDDIFNKEYNVYTLDELDKLAPNLDIKTIAKNFKVDKANKIILSQPKWLEELNKIYTDDNLQIIKDYLEVRNIAGLSNVLGQDYLDAYNEFDNAYEGTKGTLSPEENAINMVNGLLSEPLGKIYAERYSSEKVKDDVTNIINEIIQTYKERLKNLDWMSDATKEKAIEKLDKIVPKVAYPAKWEDYSSLEIRSLDEGGSLFENIQNLKKFYNEKAINKLNEPVDRTEFACPPQTVNSFYDPNTNTITIPAGILQGEFYNIDNSKERNLGGIGVVIGHELSHAFDTNGSKFDSDGNLNNWWTEEDYNKFKEKTDKVRAFYSKVKTDRGNTVNGDLTVSENVSDLGGVACCLDILNKMDNPNYKEFFENEARVWRSINSAETEENNLKTDVHSPDKIRCNVVLQQFEEFYKTYGIKQGDKMYVSPEDRLKVW